MAKKNLAKSEREWIEHHERLTQLLPKKAREEIAPMIEVLLTTADGTQERKQLIEKLNELREVKPYNKHWTSWTKAIHNITAGKSTKIAISQHHAALIDKVKVAANLGSRMAAIDFLIDSFRPIIEPLLNSNDIDELPERISLIAYDDEVTEDKIVQLQEDIKRLNKLVVQLQNEITNCSDPVHGIDFEE
ncbi:hypothetical protein ACFFK7_07610 [Pseudoalteromonas xiamenensis]|uniref:hypothetical protein n=1 Tax=Pseudoalteromonas xiamenensis TaxID=882626 RepID=UPI0035E5BBEE